jgi:hypothetical protein
MARTVSQSVQLDKVAVALHVNQAEASRKVDCFPGAHPFHVFDIRRRLKHRVGGYTTIQNPLQKFLD